MNLRRGSRILRRHGQLVSTYIVIIGTVADGHPHDDSYRAVRNFVIDVSRQPPGNSATGIHWQVAQATSLHNIVFQMSTAAGNNHQGEINNSYFRVMSPEKSQVSGWRTAGEYP